MNVLVHLANQVPGADRIAVRFARLARGDALLSAISAYELRCKILDAKASPKHVSRLQAIVREFPVEHFDLPAAHAAADVRHQLGSQPLGVFDMLLAGHARRLGAVLVTDDADFARVPGLKTENWLR